MDFKEEFDNKMKEHVKTMSQGGIQSLELLVEEAITFEYTSFHQLMGAIYNRLEILKDKVGE